LLLYGTSLLIYTLSLVRAHAAQELHKTYIVAKGQDHSAVFERVNLTADNGRQVPVRGSYMIKLHLERVTAERSQLPVAGQDLTITTGHRDREGALVKIRAKTITRSEPGFDVLYTALMSSGSRSYLDRRPP